MINFIVTSKSRTQKKQLIVIDQLWHLVREAAAITKGTGGGGTEGDYLCFFLQIHYLRRFLCRPHTDRIPDGLPAKVPAEQES